MVELKISFVVLVLLFSCAWQAKTNIVSVSVQCVVYVRGDWMSYHGTTRSWPHNTHLVGLVQEGVIKNIAKRLLKIIVAGTYLHQAECSYGTFLCQTHNIYI